MSSPSYSSWTISSTASQLRSFSSWRPPSTFLTGNSADFASNAVTPTEAGVFLRPCISSLQSFSFLPPTCVDLSFSALSNMGPADVVPPRDEDWQLEWRWGEAHPWLRPKKSASSSTVSNASSLASLSSPSRFSCPSFSSSSSSFVPSASPCSSISASPSDPSRLSLEPSLCPSSAPLCACPPSSDNMKISPFHSAFARQDGCSVPTDAAASSSTTFSTSSWLLSVPFSSLFRRSQIHGTHTPPSDRELIVCANPQVTTADTPTPAARRPSEPTARAPAASLPAASAPAAAVGEIELLSESGVKTPPARPVLFTTETGADEVRWAPSDGGRRTPAPVSASGLLPPSGSPLREEPRTAGAASDRLPDIKAAADRGAQRESETLETGVAAAGGTAKSIDLSATTASGVDSATSAAAARVDKEKREPQASRKSAHEPERVQQLLLQFGDQTLNLLQRQQMAIWSFFAFRDWRVKTLVHALSAMGEPVNLVVVNCTPPPPAPPSSSSCTSSSSTNAFDCFLVSSSPSFSHSRVPSASSLLTLKHPPLLPSFTASRGEMQTPLPPPNYSPPADRQYLLVAGAGAVAAPPGARSSAALTSTISPAVSERSIPPAVDAGGPSRQGVAATTTTTKAEAAAADAEVASLSSASPIMGEDVVRGGYSPLYHTIWLCGNRLWSPFELRRVLLHELVHAFDFARANISPNNCRHVACTEIRAYNLSGQCGWWRTRSYDIEQFNTVQPLPLPEGPEAGPLREGQQQQEGAHAYDSRQWQQTKRNRCLTHGALNSLRQHRRCQTPGVAEDAVRDVFTRCVRDTWPFLAPPERDSRWRPSRMWRPEAAEFFKK